MEEYVESDFNFHTRNMIDNTFIVEDENIEVNKNSYIFNNNNLNETTKNLNKWLLFDTASTTHLISNKNWLIIFDPPVKVKE